ncbi:hypothetical protein [Novosphingobium sp. PY1]|nr:hypothetical protein [Novosphingobium sp. PY1]
MDFELGLLSVSQEPETWRHGWAGDGGAIFELRASSGDLQFLDIDGLTQEDPKALEVEVRARGLLEGTDEWKCTSAAYGILEIIDGSMVHCGARTACDIAFEVAIVAALAEQISLHGIWWTDVWAGMRSARGGIFQDRLSTLVAGQVSAAVPQLIAGPMRLEFSF